jgi:hypothetical protein
VSSYLAGTLGRLGRAGLVAYHDGRGTGRWSYNTDISWWSSLPAGAWEVRTSWEDVMGDDSETDACRDYVPGA